jgi:hypothetical protein
MWEWQEPASGAARWGSEGMAWVAFFVFLGAAACSVAVGYVFWRDYSDASPITRGYFYALMWKRIAATLLFLSYVVFDVNPSLGVVGIILAAIAYEVVSAIFLLVWARKGAIIKRDEALGDAARTEARAVGFDFDTMNEKETISLLKRGIAHVASKAALENSDIHH